MDRNVSHDWTVPAPAASQCEDGAVALWLRDELGRQYDGTLGEPLPRDLVALVERSPG